MLRIGPYTRKPMCRVKGPMEPWTECVTYYEGTVWVESAHEWGMWDGDSPFGGDVAFYRVTTTSNDPRYEGEETKLLLCGDAIGMVADDLEEQVLPAAGLRPMLLEGILDPLVDDVGYGFNPSSYIVMKRMLDRFDCHFCSAHDNRCTFSGTVTYLTDGSIDRAWVSADRTVMLRSVMGELMRV